MSPMRPPESSVDFKFFMAEYHYKKMKDSKRAVEIYQEIIKTSSRIMYKDRALIKIGEIFEESQSYFDAAEKYEESHFANYLLRAAYLYLRHSASEKWKYEKVEKICARIVQENKDAPKNFVRNAQVLLEAIKSPKFSGSIDFENVGGLEIGHFRGTDIYMSCCDKGVAVFPALGVTSMPNFRVSGGFLADPPGPVLFAKHKNGMKMTFLNPKETIYRINEILEDFEKLPKEFYKGIGEIVVSSRLSTDRGFNPCARYDSKIIFLYDVKFQCERPITHEVMHHWDLSIAKTPSLDRKRENLSSIYYNISWDSSFSKALKIRVNDPDEYFISYTPASLSKPMRNEKEDFAYAADGYFKNGKEFREKARKMMRKGKFELAVKYLFIKYITPFKGREYGVESQEKQGLDFEEVENNLKQAFRKNPKIRKSTINALRKIKEMAIPSACGGCSC